MGKIMTSILIDRNDGLSSSTAIKGPCHVATTTNIVLYGLQTIDSVSLADGDRVLVKNQTAGYENGIYVVDTGQWRRARDFNRNDDVRQGTQVLVTQGTTQERSLWCVTSEDPIIVGTDSIVFETSVISAAVLEQLEASATAAAAQADIDAASAAASAAAAADYAAAARNNWVVNGPFTGTGSQADYLLSIDPGAVNNMFVIVGGVTQLITQTAYSLVYSGGNPYIRITVPNAVPFEVRIGNKIDVNTPVDGSVSTAKIQNGAVTNSKLAADSVDSSKIIDGSIATADLAAGAVTYAKMQNVSATSRLLGRKTAGAGVAEELTPSDGLALLGAVNKAGDTLSGALTMPTLNLSAAAASGIRTIHLQTAGADRAVLGLSSGAETGSNAGADGFLNTYDDAGGFLATIVSWIRSTGIVTFGKGIALAANAAISFAGTGAATTRTNLGLTAAATNTQASGTFTPTLTFGGGSTGQTGTYTGAYVRSGRFVLWEIHIALSAKGSSTGAAVVGGLPFTATDADKAYRSDVAYYQNMASVAAAFFGSTSGATSVVNLYTFATTGVSTITDANFTNTTALYMSGIYDMGTF